MKKPNVSELAQNIRKSASEHSPEILLGIGIAGMFTSTILAVKATPKALKLMEEKKKKDNVQELLPLEVVKATWRCYIPAASTAIFSTACLIGARNVNARRNAALAAAYKISETALSEYKDKVVETLGEKKEKEVRDKVAKQKLNDNPVGKNEVIITPKGNTLCFDPISSRYFRSDIDTIKRAENAINKGMLHDISGYASINDFYDELGLDHISIGHELGWNAYNLLDIDFSTQLTADGEPCVVIDHMNPAKYDYTRF